MKEFPANKLPLNLEEEDKHFFDNTLVKSVIPAKVRVLTNCFVSHEGLVLKNSFLVNRCAFNLKGKEDNTFYYPFWKKTLEQRLVSKYGKSLVVHNYKEKPLLLIYSKWFNYAFWITDCLLRLTIAEEEGWLDKAFVIYPEGWDNVPYVVQSLEAFKFEKFFLPPGEHVFASKLVMPETREWTSSYSRAQLIKVKNRLFKELEEKAFSKKFPTKIYLTRSSLGWRSVENETEVVEIVEKYNYVPILFENLSFWEQVYVMKNATHFIALHGAGFSNVIFMKEGSKILELINKSYADLEYKFPFWHLCDTLGLDYQYQFCEVKNKTTQLFNYQKNNKASLSDMLVNQNVIVDIVKLEANLKKME